MAVVIRMKRTGRRNRPCYRITVSDSAKPRDGRTIETVGQYDPASPVEGLRVSLNVERARHWLRLGALPSETVHTVFKEKGVYDEEGVVKPHVKRDRSGRKKKTAKSARRRAEQKARIERKSERRTARAEAAKAAKAEASVESEA